MENIQYNIFHYDTFSESYPYTIEDCAVSYILFSNQINLIHNDIMYSDYQYIPAIALPTCINRIKGRKLI